VDNGGHRLVSATFWWEGDMVDGWRCGSCHRHFPTGDEAADWPCDVVEDLTPRVAFERATALPPHRIGAVDLTELAQVAALAWEYALAVEAETADSVDITTLACHCKVLAEDLLEAAEPDKDLAVARQVLLFADGLAVSHTGMGLADLYAEDYAPAQEALRAAGCWPRGTFSKAADQEVQP
jgi:ferredoxin